CIGVWGGVCWCFCWSVFVTGVTQLCLVSSSSRNTERVSFVSVLHWLPLKTQHTGYYSHSAHTHTHQERTDLTPLSSSLYATSLCPSFSHSLSLSALSPALSVHLSLTLSLSALSILPLSISLCPFSLPLSLSLYPTSLHLSLSFSLSFLYPISLYPTSLHLSLFIFLLSTSFSFHRSLYPSLSL